MSMIKYVDRLKRMDELIRTKSTGNAERFAELLGISVSVLKENISEMRALGAPVEYCRIRKIYHYTRPCRLLFQFSDKAFTGMEQIKGGQGYFFSFRPVLSDDEIGISSATFKPRMPKSEMSRRNY